MATILSSEPMKRLSCLGMSKGSAALPVAPEINPKRPIFGQHGLAGDAVAVVAHLAGFLGTGRVAQVMAELGSRNAFDQGLLERNLVLIRTVATINVLYAFETQHAYTIN